MSKLYTMQGPAESLSAGFIDPRELSDFDAGLYFLAFPSFIKQIQRGTMSGLFDDIASFYRKVDHVVRENIVNIPVIGAFAKPFINISRGIEAKTGLSEPEVNQISTLGADYKSKFAAALGLNPATSQWVLPVVAGGLGVGFLAWMMKKN